MVDININPIDIIFTSNDIKIYNSEHSTSEFKLKIQVIPDKSGKDISQIKFWYFDSDINSPRINENIINNILFKSITYSIVGDSQNLIERIADYMRKLPNDEILVITREYKKYILDGMLLDGFISGIATYIVFLYLNENGAFSGQMPFQFTIPFPIDNGDIMNRNMFQYISLPICALAKISKGVLLQIISYIQGFINMWEPAFSNGPVIGSINESRIAMEVVSGLSNTVISSLSKIQNKQQIITDSLNIMEDRLKRTIDEAVIKMGREINNLLVESRSAVKELFDHKDNIKSISEKEICEIVETKLNHNNEIQSQKYNSFESVINNKIETVINNSHSKIHEIVSECISGDKRDYEIQRSVLGLEHRVEILYDKLDSNKSGLFSSNSLINNETIGDSIISLSDQSNFSINNKSSKNNHTDQSYFFINNDKSLESSPSNQSSFSVNNKLSESNSANQSNFSINNKSSESSSANQSNFSINNKSSESSSANQSNFSTNNKLSENKEQANVIRQRPWNRRRINN